MFKVPLPVAVMSALVSLFVSSSALAQKTVPNGGDSASAGVRITRADGEILGRGKGTESMFVAYRVSFCLSGQSSGAKGSKLLEGLVVRFASPQLTRLAAERPALVRGNLSSLQEPMNGRSDRCSELNFSVHADATLGLRIFDAASDPMLVIETGRGGSLGGQKKVTLITAR